jgi:hypothetical protein
MRLPSLLSRIRRRLLVNYCVDPAVLQPLLPRGFRPQLVDGAGIAGVCLISLDRVRPELAGGFAVGFASQSAAHRVAVEWEGPQGPTAGVFILRRDTASALVRWAGGRLFPGAHRHARFDVRESASALTLTMLASDGVGVALSGSDSDGLPRGSVFGSLDTASRFFETGSLGYSPRRDGRGIEGFRLETKRWRVQPFGLAALRASFFDALPRGSVRFDHALVMRELEARWSAAPDIAE